MIDLPSAPRFSCEIDDDNIPFVRSLPHGFQRSLVNRLIREVRLQTNGNLSLVARRIYSTEESNE